MNLTEKNNQSQREWLYTNAKGSFAMGCADRLPIRKYHGLWISRQTPAGNPEHFVLDVLERVQLPDGQSIALANYDFGQGAGNDGRKNLVEFETHPTPIWTYEFQFEGKIFQLKRTLEFTTLKKNLAQNSTCSGDLELNKEIKHCLDGIQLTYELSAEAPPSVRISLEALFTIRPIHHLNKQNLSLNGQLKKLDVRSFLFQPYDEFTFLMQFNKEPQINKFGTWYENFYYNEEKLRGYPYSEDCFSPSEWTFQLAPSKKLNFSICLFDEKKTLENKQKKIKKISPCKTPLEVHGKYQEFFRELCQSAHTFSYEDSVWNAESIIAGYPWFSSWARDTFICLPGMSLAWNNPQRALQLLKDWAPRLESHFFRSKRQLQATDATESNNSIKSNDVNCSGLDSLFLWGWALHFICEKHPAKDKITPTPKKELVDILESWMKLLFEDDCETMTVTDFGLLCRHIDGKEKASSWMDAVIEGKAVTPRFGYPNDINFLFFKNIQFLLNVQKNLKKETKQLFENYLNDIVPRYARELWVTEPQREFIGDGHDGRNVDASLRPNQLWVLLEDFNLYTKEQKILALNKITEELVTPRGLRTLSHLDSRYRGECQGSQTERDKSYHQGTVWPWLTGLYAEACLKILPKKEAHAKIEFVLDGLLEHYNSEACLYQISEIFDGSTPHIARGAPAQAWSVAELVRAIWLMEN